MKIPHWRLTGANTDKQSDRNKVLLL